MTPGEWACFVAIMALLVALLVASVAATVFVVAGAA